jgi:NAD(P)-dependent dehydrogenase (short-subunit alcohol dehydrogenase family)
MDTTRNANKTAVVTGAASGIGRAAALRLSSEGARVVACDINEDGLKSLLNEISAAGGTCSIVVGDISKQSDCDAIVTAATEQGGPYALVNNAGIMDFFIPLGELDDETWNRVLGTNLNGTMMLTRAFLPLMQADKTGSIVNISSVAGLSGGEAGVAYTTSKHAIVGLTRSVAFFYGPQGIRCNAICPAGVATNIGTTAQPKIPWAWDRLQPSFGRSERTATPDEIATLIAWLASDEAINVNGSIIASDGGWSAA